MRFEPLDFWTDDLDSVRLVHNSTPTNKETRVDKDDKYPLPFALDLEPDLVYGM